MTDQSDRIIDSSKQIYDLYWENYLTFNRLLIGFSAGAIIVVGTVFDPGGVSWLIKTALILYLWSLWFGLTVECAIVSRLASRVEVAKRIYDDDVSPIPFSVFQRLSHKISFWKLPSQLAAFFLATMSVLFDFLLPRNSDFLDVVGVILWGGGLLIVIIIVGFVASQIRNDSQTNE